MEIEFKKHPLPDCNERQREYLDACAPADRRFHELIFMVGNATYRYHQQGQREMTVELWEELKS
jgi:hypothetical protein